MASHSFKTAQSACHSVADDPQNPDFDLRDILAATTVEELSFAQFLAALQQHGKRNL